MTHEVMRQHKASWERESHAGVQVLRCPGRQVPSAGANRRSAPPGCAVGDRIRAGVWKETPLDRGRKALR
jgi:hypothetical protein